MTRKGESYKVIKSVAKLNLLNIPQRSLNFCLLNSIARWWRCLYPFITQLMEVKTSIHGQTWYTIIRFQDNTTMELLPPLVQFQTPFHGATLLKALISYSLVYGGNCQPNRGHISNRNCMYKYYHTA